MIPIFEQGTGRGFGHTLDSFCLRFDQICAEHVRLGRAKAFAFIFYDFCDGELQSVLKDQGVFVQLDRVAGEKLSIFFLHTGTKHGIERFNREFMAKLGVAEDVLTPCVVFFRVTKGEIGDLTAYELNNADSIHAFKELSDVLDSYISGKDVPVQKYIKWLKTGVRFTAVQTLQQIIKSALRTWL